jgi:long-chain acyl-CoA synthetase
MANFYDRIARTADRFPASPAVDLLTASAGVQSATYRQLLAWAGDCAEWLAGPGGVQRGDRVAIYGANDARWIAAYLGVLRLGAVAVPLDTAYTAEQVRTIASDCAARVVLTSQRLEPIAREAAGDRPGACSVARLDCIAPAGAPPPPVAVDERDAAVILYTSGTTADPKGVVLTHGSLEAERAAALAVIHVSERDAVLGVLPLFHALAQMANLLLPLSAGARVVFLESVSSTTLLDALRTRRITVFACVPQFFYLIHQRVTGEFGRRGAIGRALLRVLVEATVFSRNHLHLNPGRVVFGRVHQAFGASMRYLITGGSRFDPRIARDLYGLGLTVLNGYGLTETSGAATVMRPGDCFTGSVGPPLPGVEVSIAPETTGEDAGRPGEAVTTVGEILIRGPIVMREYFRRTDATSAALTDGWLRTGDLGYLDREGRLYITGRRKEVIVLASGKNLYPEEIEAHYRQSPFIKELCVLGLTRPDEPAAERLHAIVVPDEQALRARGTVNVRELVRFELEGLSVRLPAHKRILSYDVTLDALPRTTTGKLKRGEIERRVRATGEAHASNVTRPLSPDEQRWLDAHPWRTSGVTDVARALGRDVVRPGDNLELDLGLDSMERVELLSRLETRAARRVLPETRATIFTVRQLLEALEAAAPSGTGDDAARAEALPGALVWDSLLAQDPDPAVVRDLSRPARLRALAIGALLHGLVSIARLAIRLRVEGRERLPAHGPLLLCPNHQSYLDGIFLTAALPARLFAELFLVGASEHFETPWRARLARLINLVPVDPDAQLVRAMQAAAAGLRLGKVLVLFPEGERSIDGRLRPFRKGAAILAGHLAVPIVPVGINGLFDIWPRGRPIQWRRLLPWRRPVVTIRFGAPLTIAAGDYGGGTRRLEEQTAEVLSQTT